MIGGCNKQKGLCLLLSLMLLTGLMFLLMSHVNAEPTATPAPSATPTSRPSSTTTSRLTPTPTATPMPSATKLPTTTVTPTGRTTFNLTVKVNNNGIPLVYGQVNVSPLGITVTSTKTISCPANGRVTLTAINSGYTQFYVWYGDIGNIPNNSNPITIIMDRDKTVSASFGDAPAPRRITPTQRVTPTTVQMGYLIMYSIQSDWGIGKS